MGLRNLVQKLSVIIPQPVITRSDLNLDSTTAGGGAEMNQLLDLDFDTATARLEKAFLLRALAACDGNRSRTAEMLKMRKQLFYAKLKEHGL